MSKMLMKSLKADLPALAELIRSQGRGRDTVLAHITPKEAALLKRRGGSGTINPDTGLPEFQEDYVSGYDIDYGAPVPEPQAEVPYTEPVAGSYSGETFAPTPPSYAYDFEAQPGGFYGGAAPTAQEFAQGLSAAQPQLTRGVDPYELAARGVTAPQITTPPQADKSIFEKLGLSEKDLTRLGLGTVMAGGLTAQNVARTRQAGQQAQAAKGQLQQLATPYQQTGAQLQGAAQRGELSAASQQALQAAQAQMAQGVATRGGVGAAQMQTQLAGLRNLLLENQFNLGLRVSQIGDNYAMGAIKTGLEANRAIGAANQQFYGQLTQLLAPFITGVATAPTPTRTS